MKGKFTKSEELREKGRAEERLHESALWFCRVVYWR